MRVVALVGDLMDRSKIAAALPEAGFAAGPDECAGADTVVVDVKAHPAVIAEVRRVAPTARIVAYGRHDDPAALTAARADGADEAMPRSRFFQDPAAAIGGEAPFSR